MELGRRIGDAQVEETPALGSMEAADFEEWTTATLRGAKVYFYVDTKRQESSRRADDADERTAATEVPGHHG